MACTLLLSQATADDCQREPWLLASCACLRCTLCPFAVTKQESAMTDSCCLAHWPTGRDQPGTVIRSLEAPRDGLPAGSCESHSTSVKTRRRANDATAAAARHSEVSSPAALLLPSCGESHGLSTGADRWRAKDALTHTPTHCTRSGQRWPSSLAGTEEWGTRATGGQLASPAWQRSLGTESEPSGCGGERSCTRKGGDAIPSAIPDSRR